MHNRLFEINAVYVVLLTLKVLLLLLHMLVTSVCIRRPLSSACDVDDDVTHIPDSQSERQALLSDGHVPCTYSHDERLVAVAFDDDSGRQGNDATAQPIVS